MSVHDKAKVSTTVSEFSEHVLSSQHVTTSNFMELNVAKAMELVPNQSIDITHRLFSRLEPMPVPTFGNAKIHNKAFFVPFRTIMPSWNEFITDSVFVDDVDSSYIPQTVHLIKNTTFAEMFYIDALYARPVNDDVECDIIVTGISESRRVLTPYGKIALKILMSLGYKIDFNTLNEEFYHSAMPFLSLLKVYYDWYYPSAYSQDEQAIRANFILNYDDNEVPFDEFITPQQLRELLYDIAFVNYNSDYLVSAWDNPVSPSSGSYSNDVEIEDLTSLDSYDVLLQGGTPVLHGSSSKVISQYMIDTLKGMTDYMKRNQLAGARVIDRYLARYGVTLSDAKLKRSQWISDFAQEIKFGDVTSTSDTEGANLGAFAGKGISYGTGNYKFSTDEFGILIILSSIVPEVSFYQGQDRMTMHRTRFDFYTEEFDNQGVQALATREVFVPLKSSKQYGISDSETASFNYNDLVFGFVPRYAEYKRSFNLITGDYLLDSRNAGKDAWTLFRDVSSYFYTNGIRGTKHDIGFVQGSSDRTQYNRIFYVQNNIDDHFNIIHDFNIISRFPGKSLYDVYEFENEDDAKKVIIDVNGVKAN